MTRVSDDQLASWTKPAFDNEEERATNTERIIREAVQAHPLLKTLSVRVFAKGSFKNNTNVRKDSDVDIAVEFQGMVTTDFYDGATLQGVGLTPYSGTVSQHHFKAAVGDAMRQAFGSAAVDGSGNKVFVVRESSRSLAADVIPCTTYREYWASGATRQGIELILDRPDGKRHTNYPRQHYDNGVKKNNDTSKRFKLVVRILKNLENGFVDERKMPILPSYLMECLGYNVSNGAYTQYNTWRDIVRAAVLEIYNYANVVEPSSGRWLEVNGCKYLFNDNQRWKRDDAKNFAALAYEKVN